MKVKKKYTRFQAWIKRSGHHSPFGGFINDANLAVLANGGSTPSAKQLLALKPTIANIKKALIAGQTIETSSATIKPIE